MDYNQEEQSQKSRTAKIKQIIGVFIVIIVARMVRIEFNNKIFGLIAELAILAVGILIIFAKKRSLSYEDELRGVLPPTKAVISEVESKKGLAPSKATVSIGWKELWRTFLEGPKPSTDITYLQSVDQIQQIEYLKKKYPQAYERAVRDPKWGIPLDGGIGYYYVNTGTIKTL